MNRIEQRSKTSAINSRRAYSMRFSISSNIFVHAESAVFFDHLEELERHLVYYLKRPDEGARIARAGRAHLEQHHTGVARAKQLLARMRRRQLDSTTD